MSHLFYFYISKVIISIVVVSLRVLTFSIARLSIIPTCIIAHLSQSAEYFMLAYFSNPNDEENKSYRFDTIAQFHKILFGTIYAIIC
jgi:hypothetical protein